MGAHLAIQAVSNPDSWESGETSVSSVVMIDHRRVWKRRNCRSSMKHIANKIAEAYLRLSYVCPATAAQVVPSGRAKAHLSQPIPYQDRSTPTSHVKDDNASG